MEPRPSKHTAVAGREEGTVLLLVMLILTLISVMILSWAQEWRTELKLAGNFVQVQKARGLAEAGINYALGKLVSVKTTEMMIGQPTAFKDVAVPTDLWEADESPHTLELPDGRVEIRIADEGGKINLNTAPEATLRSLLGSLKLTELQVRTMVDAILDWRSADGLARPYGAKSPYYLGLNPPYVAKNGPFETVEELAWVRGFEDSPLVSRLSRYLTVKNTGTGINLNTAPLAVLQAIGLPDDVARLIIMTRQKAPFRNFQEIMKLMPTSLLSQQTAFALKTSPFFTITATGVTNNKGSRQTIRALVRIDANREEPWMIYSWFEGFPG
jgi:general secretion pathway protein K